MPRNRTESATRKARRARKDPSVAEEIAWSLHRNGKLGFRFRREHALLTFRLDFYCHEARLGVEFDGEQHDPERDAERDSKLAQFGIAIFRIPNRSFFMIAPKEVPSDWLRLLQQECENRTGRPAFTEHHR